MQTLSLPTEVAAMGRLWLEPKDVAKSSIRGASLALVAAHIRSPNNAASSIKDRADVLIFLLGINGYVHFCRPISLQLIALAISVKTLDTLSSAASWRSTSWAYHEDDTGSGLGLFPTSVIPLPSGLRPSSRRSCFARGEERGMARVGEEGGVVVWEKSHAQRPPPRSGSSKMMMTKKETTTV